MGAAAVGMAIGIAAIGINPSHGLRFWDLRFKELKETLNPFLLDLWASMYRSQNQHGCQTVVLAFEVQRPRAKEAGLQGIGFRV